MTAIPARQMSIGMNILGLGAHAHAWRAGEVPATAHTDVDYYRGIARLSEQGRLDAVFLADVPAVGDLSRGSATFAGGLEPTVLLTAVASATQHIGVIATASTSYNDPFNLARRLATMDHVSRGRAAWNIVTSITDAAAQNFGQSRAALHASRYARAEEFVDTVRALWDSWAPGAIAGDAASGVFIAPGAVRAIAHAGAHFSVQGPSTVPRSPQGRPVLVQAGASSGGKALGARHADAIFTAQTTLAGAQAFYREMKQRAAGHRRDPDGLKIMPGLAVVLGGTEAQAKARQDALDAHVDEQAMVAQVAMRTGIPAAALQPDAELPWHLIDRSRGHEHGSHGFADAHLDLAWQEGLTVRQLARRILVGHRLLVGTPEQVAESMALWFRSGAADGFNIMPDRFPSGAQAFVEHVVPLLRRRGIFRTDYHGPTLRDHLGLAVPAHPDPARQDGGHA